MQIIKQIMYPVAFVALIFVACRTTQSTPERSEETSKVIIQPVPQHLPPGQAKKIYGSKSAKPFAPGQRKKMNTAQYPIIIIRTPDIILQKSTDGLLYYTNNDGITYFTGTDNRLYISDSFIHSAIYTSEELARWQEEYTQRIATE